MSTAGKVLTVLILLVMAGWIVVISAVTQRNINWHEKIAAQGKELEKAEKDLVDLTGKFRDLTAATVAEQADKGRELREIGARIAAAEGNQSFAIESLSRLKFQLAGLQAAVGRAATNNETRKAEKSQRTADLEQKRSDIAKAQALNADLRDRLAKLQDEFKQALADNKALVAKAAQGRPTPRPASAPGRPSPAS